MFLYSYDNLKKLSTTKEGLDYIKKFEKCYKKTYKNKPIPALSFRTYKMFWEDGNRFKFENEYFERRERLMLLQVLALANDKYLQDLEDILFAICNEHTWALPAHNVTIDLGCAETASALSETAYILKEKLSPVLYNKIYSILKEKIVNEFENVDFWWNHAQNNWASVCASGVGITYLYLFPERFESVKDKLFKIFNNFLDGFDNEGYCYEGVAYWEYGFSQFCLFFDVYEKLLGIRPDFIDSDKVKNILKYPLNAKMGSNVYLPFADGGVKKWKSISQYYYVVKSLYNNEFSLGKLPLTLPSRKVLGLTGMHRAFNNSYEMSDIANEKSIFYKQAQVFIRKRKNYSFAVKGGDNEEFHNHNDLGAFQIVKNDRRLICDFGVGTYTKQYFGKVEERYEIFACNSLSHSVPIIDGKLQAFGKRYNATVLENGEDFITLDIKNAYENPPKKLTVKYQTDEQLVSVDYSIEGLENKVSFHFVSDYKPTVKKGGVVIKDLKITNDIGVIPKIQKHVEYFRTGEKKIAYLLDYEVSNVKDINASFKFEIMGK